MREIIRRANGNELYRKKICNIFCADYVFNNEETHPSANRKPNQE